nr:MAG TPA: hypothetical protein [Caudoviricetes sp.]
MLWLGGQLEKRGFLEIRHNLGKISLIRQNQSFG